MRNTRVCYPSSNNRSEFVSLQDALSLNIKLSMHSRNEVHIQAGVCYFIHRSEKVINLQPYGTKRDTTLDNDTAGQGY